MSNHWHNDENLLAALEAGMFDEVYPLGDPIREALICAADVAGVTPSVFAFAAINRMVEYFEKIVESAVDSPPINDQIQALPWPTHTGMEHWPWRKDGRGAGDEQIPGEEGR